MKEKFNIADFKINAGSWYMRHKSIVFFNIVMLLSCFLLLKHPVYILVVLGVLVLVMFLNGWYEEVVEPSFREVED